MNQTKSLVSKLFALSALAISLAFVPIGHEMLTSPIEETTYAWTGTQTPSVTDSYYSQASGLTGSALKSKLYTFNKPTNTSYSWYRYEDADEAYNESSSIVSLYTRHNISKSAHVGSYSWTTWNREHVYPQGNFPNSDTDNHNIFACEGQINNDRGNLKFGEVTHNSSNQLTVHGHLTDNYRANSLFEPCDEAKGEVARAVLYTSLYYNYTISSIFSSEAVCLKWHAQFPVTEREIFRNNKVYVNQGNRNPFVDHPSYANSIYNPSTPYTEADPLGGGTPVTAPNTITVTPSSSSIAVGGNVTLTANVDSGSSSVAWSSSNNNVATVSNGVVTGVAAGTATITATSTLDSSVKGTATITVKSLSTLSLSGTATNKSYSAGQSFNPAGLTITATYSDSSTANVTSSVVWTPDPLTEGTTFVTGSYGGKTVSVSGLTVTAPVGYTLVTSASQLSAGDSLIFAYNYNSTSSTAGALTSSYLSSVSDATFSADKNTITNPGSSMLFTLGGTSGSWTFSNSDGDYLSSSSKKLSFVESVSDNAKWTISVADTNSTIGTVATPAETLQYNTESPRFKTYDPGQAAIQLYRQGGGQSSVAVTGVSLNTNSLNLVVGNNSTLTATVAPTNATNKNVTWSSTNSSVASVSNGTVTANAAGSATITVTTSDGSFTDSCSVIVVAPATLSSLTFTGTPTTTAYYAGQSFNPSGLTITAHFSDGSTSNVTLQCSFSPNPLTLGATSVIASYTFGGITKTATISGITVVNRVVSSISVLNNPTKMSYTIGQSFDPTGMIIRATYNIGANSDNYTAYTYSPSAAFTTLGNKTITITSNENTNLSTSIVVNVVESIIEEGTYSITSGTTTYQNPMQPTSLIIGKTNNDLPNLTFSEIHANIRLAGKPYLSDIMLGRASNEGGSFKITLGEGLFASKVEFVGNTKDTDASGTQTISVNDQSVAFSSITNVSTPISFTPYSNVITISTTARIWTHEIKITALSAQSCALEFGQYFLDTTAAQCASKNVTSVTWNTIQSFYNGLNVDIQNAIKASASNQNGNAMEHAMARYDDIISKYGLTDFLGTGNPSKGLNGMSNSSNYMLVFISVIGMFTAIGCTLYLVKKKKEKLS